LAFPLADLDFAEDAGVNSFAGDFGEDRDGAGFSGEFCRCMIGRGSPIKAEAAAMAREALATFMVMRVEVTALAEVLVGAPLAPSLPSRPANGVEAAVADGPLQSAASPAPQRMPRARSRRFSSRM